MTPADASAGASPVEGTAIGPVDGTAIGPVGEGDGGTAPDAPRGARSPVDSGARAAAWTFGLYVAAALPILIWMGTYRWFLGDEWTFLTDRSVTPDDLFRAHNQHWSTIPVLVYRGIYSIVRLRAYWPYQLVVICLHLTAAVLLRVVMRRAGVGPWIATIVAGSFVLLGPAEDNILWAFQVGFAGALVLGLVQSLLADHDGPIDRRDWCGLGVGLLCLITSGQAPALILAAGLVCLFRQRWWAAAFHTVPLGAIYGVWFLVTDVPAVGSVDPEPFTLRSYAAWMWDAAVGLFTGLGHFTPLAIAFVVILVAGLITAARVEGMRNFVRRAAVPMAMLLGAVASMSAAAPARFALVEGGAKAGRYVGVMAAMSLPAFAVAADAMAKRWRWAAPVVIVLLLLPIPFNVVVFGDNTVLSPANFATIRNNVATLPDNPLIRQVPPWVRHDETLLGQPDMTVGWLLEADRRGELPEPTGPMNPFIAGMVPIQLGVATVDGASTDGLACDDYTEPLALDPRVGDRWYFDSPIQIAGRVGDAPGTLWVPFPSTGVEITLPDLHLLVTPAANETSFRFCR